MENKGEGLGIFSLAVAVCGFVLTILLALGLVILGIFVQLPRPIPMALVAALFVGLEVIALVTAFAAASSRAGKVAIILALLLLGGGVGLCGVGYARKWLPKEDAEKAPAEPAPAAQPEPAPPPPAPPPARPPVPPPKPAEPEPPPSKPRGEPGEPFPGTPFQK